MTRQSTPRHTQNTAPSVGDQAIAKAKSVCGGVSVNQFPAATMAGKMRALQDLMTAVDAGHVVVDSGKLVAPPRRSTYGRKPASAETSTDTSFEFSAVVSYSSASPASMVFSDGQLRAHQFPAVRSSADSSQAPSPARRTRAAGAATGSKKRVSFAADGAGQGKKSGGGGLLGCMASACGASRNQVVEPARNANRKVVAV